MDGNNMNNQNQQSYNQEADYQQVNQQYNQQQYDQQQQYYQQQYEMQQQYYQQLYEQQQAQQAGQQYAGQQEQQAYQQYAQQPQFAQQQQYDQLHQQYIQPQANDGNNNGNSSGGNGGKKKTGLIIGIISAIVVIAAAIIIAIVLKNKKDNKDAEKKTTNEVTTAEGITTEDVTSELTTTEEIVTEEYYKLVNIVNDTDADYVSLLQELEDEGKYNYAVFNYETHTGYVVVAGELLGSEFTFDDKSITMEGESNDYNIDGDTLTISYEDEMLEFERITPEEFAVMDEALKNAIVMKRGETTTEDIVFPYEDIKVTIPEGFTLLGNIDSGGYTDDIHCQKSVDSAGVVASYFVYVDWWDLAENGKTIQDCVDEWGFANNYETVDFQSDNGFDIYWLGRADKPSEYMSDGFSDGNGESKYCHMIEYFGYFEAGGNAYGLTLYIDADYYGEDADNVAMEILNGLSYR